jgi:hypothetical protein
MKDAYNRSNEEHEEYHFFGTNCRNGQHKERRRKKNIFMFAQWLNYEMLRAGREVESPPVELECHGLVVIAVLAARGEVPDDNLGDSRVNLNGVLELRRENPLTTMGTTCSAAMEKTEPGKTNQP